MLNFRNVDADPADPPASWPFEAKVTAVERGTLSDYRRIKDACDHDEELRREFLDVCDLLGNQGGAAVLRLAIEGLSRENQARLVAIDMQRAVEDAGLSLTQAAARLGTSVSRLSTYLSVKVTPRADIYRQILALRPRR